MTLHPKPDLAAMSGAVFLALVAILTGLSILAQCHHEKTYRTPNISYRDCHPWPQCQDVEPPEKP